MAPVLKGKLEDEIQSYHIMDNPKYLNAKLILDLIKQVYTTKIEKEDKPVVTQTVEQLLGNFTERVYDEIELCKAPSEYEEPESPEPSEQEHPEELELEEE